MLMTAAALKISRLYHYTPFNDVRLARVFREGTLYCSNPQDFNDPWDCRPCFSKSVLNEPSGHERVAEWFARIGRKHFPSLLEAEHQRREQILRSDKAFVSARIDEMTSAIWGAVQKQYRVFCVSPLPDSPLMWAHYARSHTGVCLEFSVSNELMCGALPVTYLDQYPLFDLSEPDAEHALSALLTKSRDWSYEREFRVVAAAAEYDFQNLLRTKENFVDLPEGALISIIVGCLMPESDRQVVRRLVNRSRYPIALNEVRRVPDSYSLEIRPMDG
jgi:hypothetical protein